MPKCDFNFIEITFRHGYSPVHLLHIFKIPFPRNTSGWLFLFWLSYLSDFLSSKAVSGYIQGISYHLNATFSQRSFNIPMLFTLPF